MTILTNITSFILLIGVLVFIHELGHFLAAKSIGLRVEKFYIGFNLFGLGLKKKIGETEFGIGLFPIGGYVKVAGMIDESFDDNYKGGPDEYVSKNALQKVWFTSGGVIFNFILAFLLFSVVTFSNGGYEALNTNIIGDIKECPLDNEDIKCPAEKANLFPGDKIIAIDGMLIKSWDDMKEQIVGKPDKTILLEYERNNKLFKTEILTTTGFNEYGQKIGIIGIVPEFKEIEPGLFFQSIQYGFNQLILWLERMIYTIFYLFTGQVGIEGFAGPIGIASIAGDASEQGLSVFLTFMAILSVNLGIINILPLPGLDGGHALIAIIEGILGRRIPFKVLMTIQQIGVFLLLILFFIIMKNDIMRLF